MLIDACMKVSENHQFLVRASFLEIYNEEVSSEPISALRCKRKATCPGCFGMLRLVPKSLCDSGALYRDIILASSWCQPVLLLHS